MHLRWNKKYKDGFFIEQNEELYQQAYLDEVLVWKTDQNISVKNVKIVDTDVPFILGFETEPNVIRVVV